MTAARVPSLSLGILLLALVPVSQPAAAQTSEVFVVAGVAVDATAETAAKARDIALGQGQRQAAAILLHRLTRRADWGRLPDLADTEIAELVQSLEVAAEKTSTTRYLARLTFQFKSGAVRTLLRGRAIPYSETASRPVLVIPVYEAQGVQLLWDDGNDWLAAWGRRPATDSLVPLVVPLGDLQDLAAIGVEDALAGQDARLAAIKARYDAASAAVVQARRTAPLDADKIALDVSLVWYRDGGESQALVESFTGPAADGVRPLLDRVAAAVAARLEEVWKEETLLRFDAETRLSVSLPLGSLGDWVRAARRLDAVAEIKRVELAALSTGRALLVLHYYGDPVQLTTALAQQDLRLEQRDGYWTLTVAADGAAAAPE